MNYVWGFFNDKQKWNFARVLRFSDAPESKMASGGDDLRWPGLNRLCGHICHNCGNIVKPFRVKEVSKETVEVDLSPSLSHEHARAHALRRAPSFLRRQELCYL